MLIPLLVLAGLLTLAAAVLGLLGFLPWMAAVLGAQIVILAAAISQYRLIGTKRWGERYPPHAGQRQRHIEALVALIGDPVAWVGADGVVLAANARAAAAGIRVGDNAESVDGGWLAPLVRGALAKGEAMAPPAPENADTNNTATPDSGLLKIHQGNGEMLVVPHAAPVVDAAGNIEAVVVVLRDKTAVKRAEESRAKLLSTLSHDLRTPMTSIKMSIHLLLEDAASRLEPRQLELLKAARDDAERLHRMMEEMLSRARGAA